MTLAFVWFTFLVVMLFIWSDDECECERKVSWNDYMDVVDDIADLDNEVYELHLQIEDLKEAVAILQNEGVE